MNHIVKQLIDFDIRYEMFKTAVRFVDYELVPGDILEFGVYTGRSLALLAHAANESQKDIHKIPFQRRIIGFDSFEGLKKNEHPRWSEGLFKTNHSFHPFMAEGERVTAQSVLDLFNACELSPPFIKEGNYEDAVPDVIESQAAIVHIDCDLYESTKTVFESIHETLQEGTVLLFDDWFNFKGHPAKGEQGAFRSYIDAQSRWSFVEYQNYATFGKSFIVTENNAPDWSWL